MKNVILVYAITQLLTNAYGLAVIESVRPLVVSKLQDMGYIKNKNSLYNFSNTLSIIAKGFIPFYYLIKAINIIKNRGNVDAATNELINKKAYIKEDEEENYDNSIFGGKKEDNIVEDIDLAFEKPEKYTARHNDVSNLYDTYETPIEYITRESTKDDELTLSPYMGEEKIIEHKVVKDQVTNKDIAKAICNLNSEELKLLQEKIKLLQSIKKKNTKELKLEKDIA